MTSKCRMRVFKFCRLDFFLLFSVPLSTGQQTLWEFNIAAGLYIVECCWNLTAASVSHRDVRLYYIRPRASSPRPSIYCRLNRPTLIKQCEVTRNGNFFRCQWCTVRYSLEDNKTIIFWSFSFRFQALATVRLVAGRMVIIRSHRAPILLDSKNRKKNHE